MKSIIVFIMLLVPSLCDVPPEPDWGSPEEFLKGVNELRANFAKDHMIPNTYKIFWSNVLADDAGEKSEIRVDGHSNFSIDSYRNVTEAFTFHLIGSLQGWIGCSSLYDYDNQHWKLRCFAGLVESMHFLYPKPGEDGSQCPPRFKGEDGLCVPVDPSKHTFWGTKEELLEDVNFMRKKIAKEFGIPNMHQLTWNESLVEVLKSLNVAKTSISLDVATYPASNDSSWDGFGKNWRITELPSFSAAVAAIDEAVQNKFVLNHEIIRKTMIRGKEESTDATEMIHPFQTSIGCMKKKREKDGEKYVLTACLLGNIGQWPSDWKIDIYPKKIPGSECMDGYVNDDGLCILAPPTTTPEQTTPQAPTTPKTTPKEAESVPATPMKSDEKKEKEGASVEEDAELEPGQEALESSTRNYSYGP